MIKFTMAANTNKRRLLPICLFLLSANLEIQAQQQAITPPAGSGAFGTSVVVLSNGNYVVTDPSFDDGALTDVGAAHLYNGSTHTLISTLKGSTAGAQVSSGGVTALTNGNFVVGSPAWSDGVSARLGAATFVNGTTGLNGIISSSNSLVGGTVNDSVGSTTSITALSNNNYVVISSRWDNGSNANAGAVTWADGSTGITGTITNSNSLTGSKANDQIGNFGIKQLTNSNYVISSPRWDNGSFVDAGAATWVSGVAGITGSISSSNSLVGGKSNDYLGSRSSGINGVPSINGVTILTNGNYVVASSSWDNGSIVDVGAATWGNGATGVSGTINSSNSLTGSAANDAVSFNGINALTNGNYVVLSENWKNGTASGAGALTWGNGNTGITGIVNISNSLVGSTAGDAVGITGTALPNGNYVVTNFFWDNGSAYNAGAVTWIDGNGGTTGLVSVSNSLVGSTSYEEAGKKLIKPLTNGNYLVLSNGAVTWANGATGITGVISSSNSLITVIGSSFGVAALSNGNYVTTYPTWDNGSMADAGAVTWCNGTTGTSGLVSSANSLVGTKANDNVGTGITALANGNYVVGSPNWDNGSVTNVGAVTWGNGTTGITGPVNTGNSLIGTTTGDNVGGQYGTVLPLSNGNYVIANPVWNNGSITDAGAVTWGNGASGTTGTLSVCNSLVGSTANENVGNVTPVALDNGNYVTGTSNWDNGTALNVGARVWGDANSALTGTINSCNGVTGTMGTGTSIIQARNPVYNYEIVANRTANSAIAYYGTTAPTDTALANNMDVSSAIICAGTAPASFATQSGCRIIGSVVPNGGTPVSGMINARAWIESLVPIYSGQPYVARHYQVVPTTNATTATGKVTLYFTQQEFNDFNANAGSTADLPAGPGDAAGVANLRIGRYAGTTNNGTGLPGSYPNSVTVIDPADADILWNAAKNWWEVSFNMVGSGGLIVQTFPTPLPLDLLAFKGKLQGVDALLNWKTENENHTAGFDVERSSDGKTFTAISFESSANRPGINYYTFTDRNVSLLSINEIYYRLKQKDTDGKYKYSQVVRLSLDSKNGVTLYPNPANIKATLSISLTAADHVQLRILDNVGRVVQQQQTDLSSGTTNMNLDFSELASGIYYLELSGNNLNERKQFVKQ